MVSLRWNYYSWDFISDISKVIDPFKELLQLVILFVFFFGVVYVNLPRIYTEHPKGKFVVIAIASILALGLFYAKPYVNFFFESFAIIGFILIITVMFLMMFNLVRQFNADKSIAFTFSYSLIFVSFLILSPSLFDTLEKTIPSLVSILSILFILSFLFLIYKAFEYIFKGFKTDSKGWAGHLRHKTIHNVDRDYIRREINEEKEEEKEIKDKIIPLTNISSKDIDSIERGIRHISEAIKHRPLLSDNDKIHISNTLKKIGSFENHAKKSLDNLMMITLKWKKKDKSKINEMERRLSKTHEKYKKDLIKKEIDMEKQKLVIFDYLNNQYMTVYGFLENFDNWIGKSVKSIELNNSRDAYACIMIARQLLNNSIHALQNLFRYEKKAIEINKFEQQLLNKELKH